MIVGYPFFFKISRSLYALKIVGTKIISFSSIFEILLPLTTSFYFMKLMCLRMQTLHSQWFTVLLLESLTCRLLRSASPDLQDSRNFHSRYKHPAMILTYHSTYSSVPGRSRPTKGSKDHICR